MTEQTSTYAVYSYGALVAGGFPDSSTADAHAEATVAVPYAQGMPVGAHPAGKRAKAAIAASPATTVEVRNGRVGTAWCIFPPRAK